MGGGRGRATAGLLLVVVLVLAGSLGAAAAVGDIVTVAGTGTAGFSGDGGPAREAELSSPGGLALDTSGRLLIADRANHAVRRIGTDGTVVTVAGTGGTSGYDGDGGPAVSARLDGPRDVALRPNGIVFIADTGNHVIRDIDGTGVITTLAGTGAAGFSGDGGPATAAQLSRPSGVASRPSGTVVIADTGNHRIRMVDAHGIITTLAGTGTPGSSGDDGPATAAQLDRPEGVAVLPNGTVYVADTANHRIRRIDHSSGVITTVAGTGVPGSSGDGGPATEAQLKFPAGLAVAADGAVLITDTGNHLLRRIAPDGTITTIAGTGKPGFSGDGGPATKARLNAPSSTEADGDGNVLLADTGNHRVREILALPDPPVFTATDPGSPATTTAPRLLGKAEADTVVTIYTDAHCARPPVATGTATAFADPGVQVEVAADRTTAFYATATDPNGRTSQCSTSSITYEHIAPDAPPEPAPEATPAPGPAPGAAPAPAPAPAPKPGSALAPTPDPGSAPDPAPAPEPDPEPAPAPESEPAPSTPRSTLTPRDGSDRTPTALWTPTVPTASDGVPLGTLRGSESAASEVAGAPERAGFAGKLAALPAAMLRFASDHADESVFPLGLLLVLLVFLLVQDQIDRRDPKLALAPIEEPELHFATLSAAGTGAARGPVRGPGHIWTARRRPAYEELR